MAAEMGCRKCGGPATQALLCNHCIMALASQPEVNSVYQGLFQSLFAEYAATLSDADEDKNEDWGTPRNYWEGEAEGFLAWLKGREGK